MALEFSIPVIINTGLIKDSLRYEAGKLGIPVIAYEAGEALRIQERAVVTGVRAIMSVRGSLGMLPHRQMRTVRAEPYIAQSSARFRAPTDGLFRPFVELGARVEAGDKLGTISRPFSSDETVPQASADGIVICIHKLPLVNEGEAPFHIAQFEKSAAMEVEIAAHESIIRDDRLYENGELRSGPDEVDA